MPILRVSGAVLLSMFIALAPLQAQTSKGLDALNSEMARLYQAGRYQDAIPLAERILKLTEQTFSQDHPNAGAARNNLAELYRAQGRAAEAEALYKRDLAITTKALGPDHADIGITLDNLAQLYQDQGYYEGAEALYKRALAIDEKALGPDHPSVGTTLHNLAGLYYAAGNLEEAEAFYNRALSVRQKTLGAKHPDVAATLSSLALLHAKQDRITKAQDLYSRALAIVEEVSRPGNSERGGILHNLAFLHQTKGRVTEAEKFYKSALASDESVFGDTHPYRAVTLNNLAGLYQSIGRTEEAERLYKEALSSAEAMPGSSRAQTAITLARLVSLYKAAGRASEEKDMRQKLLRLPLAGTRHSPVYFATTRAHAGHDQLYGRRDGNTLSFGRIILQVPDGAIRQHRKARYRMLTRLGEPHTRLTNEDVFKRVRHCALNSGQLAVAIKDGLKQASLFKREALIFVHGFNVDFNEATQLASQVAFDIQFDGALIAFSWASLGRANPIAYTRDRGRADQSVTRFVTFLDQLSEQLPDVTLHVMGHAMGNRVLTRAFSQIAARPQGAKRPNLGEIIVLNADVDPEWCEKLGAVRPHVRGITNYVTQDNWALLISKGIRFGKGRCGRLPRVYTGIETIDTTGIDKRTKNKGLGFAKKRHGVFASNPVLFGEMTRLLATGERTPDKRTPEFTPVKSKDGRVFWAYDTTRDIVITSQADKE